MSLRSAHMPTNPSEAMDFRVGAGLDVRPINACRIRNPFFYNPLPKRAPVVPLARNHLTRDGTR